MKLTTTEFKENIETQLVSALGHKIIMVVNPYYGGEPHFIIKKGKKEVFTGDSLLGTLLYWNRNIAGDVEWNTP